MESGSTKVTNKKHVDYEFVKSFLLEPYDKEIYKNYINYKKYVILKYKK